MSVTPVFQAPTLYLQISISTHLKTLPRRLNKKLPGTVHRITLAGVSFWKTAAARRLRASRDAYVKAIKSSRTGKDSSVITLTGPLAVAVELGAKGYDMRGTPGVRGLLKNAKHIKDRKIPGHVWRMLKTKGPYVAKGITWYKMIPLNVKHTIRKPANPVWRMVHDGQSNARWQHPGWKPADIRLLVIDELQTSIIPRHIKRLMEECK